MDCAVEYLCPDRRHDCHPIVLNKWPILFPFSLDAHSAMAHRLVSRWPIGWLGNWTGTWLITSRHFTPPSVRPLTICLDTPLVTWSVVVVAACVEENIINYAFRSLSDDSECLYGSTRWFFIIHFQGGSFEIQLFPTSRDWKKDLGLRLCNFFFVHWLK